MRMIDFFVCPIEDMMNIKLWCLFGSAKHTFVTITALDNFLDRCPSFSAIFPAPTLPVYTSMAGTSVHWISATGAFFAHLLSCFFAHLGRRIIFGVIAPVFVVTAFIAKQALFIRLFLYICFSAIRANNNGFSASCFCSCICGAFCHMALTA